MQPRPALLKRSLRIFAARPIAYAVAAVLPYVIILGLPFLIVRIIHLRPSAEPNADPAVLWRSMSWVYRSLIILAFILSANMPAHLTASATSRMVLDHLKQIRSSFSSVLWLTLRFIPAAVFYSIAIGIPVMVGAAFLVVPGLLITCVCALTVPSAIDGRLGPVAALRRGFSVIDKVFWKVMVVYACYTIFVLFSWAIVSAAVGVMGESRPAGWYLLAVWFVLLLLGLGLVNIMLTLLYCDASEMNAAAAAAAGLAATAGQGSGSGSENRGWQPPRFRGPGS